MAERRVYFSTGSYFLLMLLLLLLPFQWMCAGAIAICFHEICHYFAIKILAENSPGVRFYSYGARMPLPEMRRGRELLCALAGPAGGVILMVFHTVFPKLAFCAMVQTAYNLLPIYPLDGGRALRCVLELTTEPPRAARIVGSVSRITRWGLVIFGIYATLCTSFGVVAAVFTAIVLIRTK